MINEIKHQVVEFIPEDEFLEEGILYISLIYECAIHKCCCGCGIKVCTPIDDKYGWKLTLTDTATLEPSIGNWQIPCKTHYYIREGKVIWL